ncbi:MAG: hypothetical protein GF317_12640 [Candidatus Lokiarchaeota archaeon]|nr:hypothetical protein [Candidatus Lokiarchaeota archaeon]MBD3200495.1 hypothetical protein [Candidatus Lokiarchaeota archaeon]
MVDNQIQAKVILFHRKMNTEQFVKELSSAQSFMAEEEYEKALEVLYNLREIEKKGDFDYSLTHKLYQLISNSESLLNQQKILGILKKFESQREKIAFDSLSKILKDENNFSLESGTIRREIEMLILRGKVNYKIQGDSLIL